MQTGLVIITWCGTITGCESKLLHCVSVPSSFVFVPSTFPVVFVRWAAGLEAVGDVPVGEVLEDPLGEGQRLDLMGGDRVAQDGSAQVGQAGHFDRRPPEPDVAVSGSARGGQRLLLVVRWRDAQTKGLKVKCNLKRTHIQIFILEWNSLGWCIIIKKKKSPIDLKKTIFTPLQKNPTLF